MASNSSQTESGFLTIVNDARSVDNDERHINPLHDLKQILSHYASMHKNFQQQQQQYTEVYPDIYIGESKTANSIDIYKQLNVGFVIIASDSFSMNDSGTYTMNKFYTKMNLRFLGIFKRIPSEPIILENHFESASEFIQLAIVMRSKVLVLCENGNNYSASLVVAYLMLYKSITVSHALEVIATHRVINPDDTILKQLYNLNENLRSQTEICSGSRVDHCTCLPRCVVGKLIDIMVSQFVRNIPSSIVAEVYPGILIGSSEIEQDLGCLQRLGIKAVLNACHDQSKTIHYLKYGIKTSMNFPQFYYDDMSDLKECFHFAARFIEVCTRSNSRILVYCHHGIGRSVCLVVGYLMIYKHFTAQAAIQQIGNIKAIMPNPHYLRQLRDLSISLQMEWKEFEEM